VEKTKSEALINRGKCQTICLEVVNYENKSHFSETKEEMTVHDQDTYQSVFLLSGWGRWFDTNTWEFMALTLYEG